MAGLPTTPRRLAAATAVGLLLPPAIVALAYPLVLVARSMRIEPEALLAIPAAIALLNAGVFVLPGLPLWFVCHRLRVRLWAACLCGAASGLLLAGGLSALVYYLDDFTRINVVGMGLALGGAAAVIGALTVGLMWRIAYPAALQRSEEQVAAF